MKRDPDIMEPDSGSYLLKDLQEDLLGLETALNQARFIVRAMRQLTAGSQKSEEVKRLLADLKAGIKEQEKIELEDLP